ncbi:MAG: hemerythrin domain-containing protein [Bryobacterales bacterium]|nr:hemerythrin domain-containing protein [Bryobacterales bacterium]
MSQLIDELKADHKRLIDLLEKARRLGATPEAFQILKQARSTLLTHIGKEDARLYPAMRAAGDQHGIASLLNLFGSDMAKVSESALRFFTKHGDGKSTVEFTADFARLMAVITTRMRREEERLYPAYEKLSSGKAA